MCQVSEQITFVLEKTCKLWEPSLILILGWPRDFCSTAETDSVADQSKSIFCTDTGEENHTGPYQASIREDALAPFFRK